jgi:hypothetical protein
MSEIISFRLSKNNPREARALMILQKWQDEGHNTRYIVTEALLILQDSNGTKKTELLLAELNNKLTDVSQIVSKFCREKTAELTVTSLIKPNTELSDNFVRGIRNAAKPGLGQMMQNIYENRKKLKSLSND